MPDTANTIKVRCYRSAKDREAPPVNDGLINEESLAVTRGKRFLDDPDQGGYYHAFRRSLKVPYKAGLKAGCWIKITDEKTGLNQQPVKVLSVKISISRNSVWANIETVEYRERIGDE